MSHRYFARSFFQLFLACCHVVRRAGVMMRHRISGLTKSVPISTVGCSVVPKMIISQPASAFELTATFVPVMYELRRVPIFSVPVMQTNPLHQLCIRDMLALANGELDHLCLFNAPVLMPPPFSELDYLKKHPAGFYIGKCC